MSTVPCCSPAYVLYVMSLDASRPGEDLQNDSLMDHNGPQIKKLPLLCFCIARALQFLIVTESVAKARTGSEQVNDTCLSCLTPVVHSKNSAAVSPG